MKNWIRKGKIARYGKTNKEEEEDRRLQVACSGIDTAV